LFIECLLLIDHFRQKVVTAFSTKQLVQKYGNYYHGNPYRSRKVVLSKELLDSHELTAVTIVYGSMVDRFLREAKLASERAKKENCPLLLVFCHGLQNYNLSCNIDLRRYGPGVQHIFPFVATSLTQSVD
jgi:hypothetical protein